MAKKFLGFKPETMQNKILPALGYNGAMDQKSINAFLAASPAAAAKMGKYTMTARQMVEGKPVNMAPGGYTATKGSGPGGTYRRSDFKNAAGKTIGKETPAQMHARVHGSVGKDIFGRDIGNSSSSSSSSGGGGGTRINLPSIGGSSTIPVSPTVPGVSTVNGQVVGGTPNPANMMPSGSLLSQQIGADPNAIVTRAGVVAADGGPNALIPQGTGQAGQAAQAGVTTAPVQLQQHKSLL